MLRVLPAADLAEPPEDRRSHVVVAAAAAAKIVEALATGTLIAPTQSVVEPLPHQLRALSRCASTDPVRMLLADEVGLGKTIEAGLVVTELLLRGLRSAWSSSHRRVSCPSGSQSWHSASVRTSSR